MQCNLRQGGRESGARWELKRWLGAMLEHAGIMHWSNAGNACEKPTASTCPGTSPPWECGDPLPSSPCWPTTAPQGGLRSAAALLPPWRRGGWTSTVVTRSALRLTPRLECLEAARACTGAVLPLPRCPGAGWRWAASWPCRPLGSGQARQCCSHPHQAARRHFHRCRCRRRHCRRCRCRRRRRCCCRQQRCCLLLPPELLLWAGCQQALRQAMPSAAMPAFAAHP